MRSELEGEEDDDSSCGKGGGTSTGATKSNSNGGSGIGNSKSRAAASQGPKDKDSTSNLDDKKKSRTAKGGGTSTEARVSRSKGGSGAASTEKSCLHCGNALLHGREVKLHECACGKVYHHLCAGLVNHTGFSVCYDCSVGDKPSQAPQSTTSASDRRSTLKKALDALSEAHQSLLNLSSEKELCNANEWKQKAPQFSKACTTVKEHATSAWRVWTQSDCADPAESRELQHLIGLVLVLLKGTVQHSEVNFIWKKMQRQEVSMTTFFLIILQMTRRSINQRQKLPQNESS